MSIKEIDIEKLPRKKTYEWFKSFSNSTYGITKELEVTKLVEHTKDNQESFFINMLYIVVNALNSVEELKMRFKDNKPVIYDDINPAITVMTKGEVFENVRFVNKHNYKDFYKIAKEEIDKAKNQCKLNNNSYNLLNDWDEYYITCLPWTSFTGINHPIPDDIHSQVVPRICWGKYTKNNDKYEISLNITVSHIFVDGYHLSKVFKEIESSLSNIDNILK